MTRTQGIVGGIAAVLLVGIAITVITRKAEPRFAAVSKGTEIPLILVKELESGADSVGTDIQFLAAEDVLSPTGEIVVKKGAVAYGKVVRSRGEGAFSGIVNQPARLDISITAIEAVDGRQMQVSAVQGGSPTDPFQLNRDNTGLPPGSQDWDKAWDQPEQQKDLVQFAQLIQSGKAGDLASNPATADLVKKLSTELNLDSVSKATGGNADLNKIVGMVGKVAGGGNGLGEICKAGLGQVGAVIELVKVAGYVGNRLGDSLKGRKIHAYIGTPLKAYVVEDASVKLPETEG